MSASPDNRDQRGSPPQQQSISSTVEINRNGGQRLSSPRHLRESNGTDTSRNSIAHAVESGAEDPAEQEHESHDTGTEGTATDTKDFTLPLPETIHRNTPVGPEYGSAPNGVPGPPVSSPSHSSTSDAQDCDDDGPADARVNGRVNGQVNSQTSGQTSSQTSGTARANSEPNGTGNAEAVGSEDNSPRSPSSSNPQTANTNSQQHRTGQETVTSRAGNGEYRDNSPAAPSSQDQPSNPNPNSGSQADAGGQGGDADNHEPQGDGNNNSNRNAPVPALDQLSAGSEENNSLSRLTDRAALSSDRAFNTAPGPALILSRNGASASHSQHHWPGNNANRFTPASQAGAASQPPTLFHPAPPGFPFPRSSSSLNPIAPSFVPRPEETGGVSPMFAVPAWQPDSEVSNCPICNVRFGVFLRKHHCRKCGRVVCDGCSPHRITIPNAFIVRPPGDPGLFPPYYYPYPRGEGNIMTGPIGGGERVRLCNPCVPDPNTEPPQALQPFRPIAVDGRPSVARAPNDNYGPGARSYPHHQAPSSQSVNGPRIRSASTVVGRDQSYYPFISNAPPFRRYMSPNPYFSQLQISQAPSRFRHPAHGTHSGRARASSSSSLASGLDRPLPNTPAPEPEIPEEDVCPVCHLELPSRSLPNFEALREIHINNCINYHTSVGAGLTVSASGPGGHGTPPQRTTRRTRMFPYVATEKDCVNDAECIICLEEFRVGQDMARLECFCRFHRSCIDSWFVEHPGRCPVHQHDSFGY
ncbi:hypothetical protein F4861DRAFT_538941 [Xylaria intraflava]|nr:hypothetical protein F4861DRAFT_538941 [Xylaria intraflava]